MSLRFISYLFNHRGAEEPALQEGFPPQATGVTQSKEVKKEFFDQNFGIAESKYESGDRCNQTGATHRKRY